MARQHEAEIRKLQPTQITIGLIEVHVKRKALERLGKHKQREFLAAHLIPAVIGPQERIFITDHHHLARAALEAGIDSACFLIEADFAHLDPNTFWRTMVEKHWAHPIDEHGHRQPCTCIPGNLEQLRDDPYRSLAGAVRSAGGYEKTPTAFAEFLWADFFRRRLALEPTPVHFQHTVDAALLLARSPAAACLPGFRGAAA